MCKLQTKVRIPVQKGVINVRLDLQAKIRTV